MSHTERPNDPTDLTGEQWQILRIRLPQPSRRGAPQRICRRPAINAILYLLCSGCARRLLLASFPNRKTLALMEARQCSRCTITEPFGRRAVRSRVDAILYLCHWRPKDRCSRPFRPLHDEIHAYEA